MLSLTPTAQNKIEKIIRVFKPYGPVGFEPTTNCLLDNRSIQMSYDETLHITTILCLPWDSNPNSRTLKGWGFAIKLERLTKFIPRCQRPNVKKSRKLFELPALNFSINFFNTALSQA